MYRVLSPAVVLMALALPASPAEQGQLDASPALFTVLAALDAAGYGVAPDSPANHPLRAAVRADIARRNPASLKELKEYFASRRKPNDTADLSQYISFALCVDGPPDFRMTSRTVELPPDVEPLQSLGPLLARFYKEAGIEDLWNRSQTAIEQVLGLYQEPVSRSVFEVNAYLRSVTSGWEGHRFQIFVEPLAPPHQVQTRSYRNDYYVVVSFGRQPQVFDIRHAYLHYLLDPLASRHADLIGRKRGLSDHAQRAAALAESYKSDFLLLATESLIKAVEARLDRKPAMVQQALEEGFILAPHFAEQLPSYEKQEASMRFHFAELVKAVDLKREEERLSRVEFASRPAARPVLPAVPPPAPTGAHKTMGEAEDAYTARELERAKSGFRKVLQETADEPLHAQAYYGLARIAVLEKDPELAERLFQKALESAPEPQVKAWVLVYLGRLSDAAGERGKATEFYQLALKVEGASDAARRAAEQGAQKSFHSP